MTTIGTNSNQTQPVEVQPVPSTSQRRQLWPLLVSVVAALLLGLVIHSGIHQRALAEGRVSLATERAAVTAVNVVHPKTRASDEQIVLPGYTQAFSDTPIYARTNGYLKRWYFDIGAHVEKGQLLAEIDTPEIDQQLDQARADLKAAQANEQLAQITAARWQNLLKTNSVSRQETDQAVSDLNAKQATVESMTANVHRLEQLQSFENIYAPFTGVITARNTDIGDLINAGAGGAGTGGAPQELFHMAAVDKLRVFVALPEVDLRAAKDGAKATLTLDEFPGQTFQGVIVRNSDSIDLSSRTLNVEVDINNSGDRIKTGAYVFVHLSVPDASQDTATSVVIPANTLLFRSEGLRVGVVRNDRAQLVPITIGRDYGSTVEAIAGLKPGDLVIVNPSDSLTTGTQVRVNAMNAEGSK
ncbi:MAG TPA: efflux RND transporter periplasmic adaptor subunit [Terracidiphilus sp.]|nr:efflux RND transporter periplasmic adaptor subunit [Terracidiphilus sp.]